MYYTWIFICCDILSLILQGAGGGIAATSTTDYKKQTAGNDVMLAGIVFQVATLLVFAGFSVDYYIRRSRSSPVLSREAEHIKAKASFKLFMFALLLAFLTIFTRCVFRIAEMAPGWRNPIFRDETEFIVLDGVMITVAVLMLTVFHPGYCFPRLGGTIGRSKYDEKREGEEEEEQS